jgi:cobalt/nickel transport system ATP-binding protein
LSADPLLRGRDLHYRYLDRYLALDGVSLDVHPGEFLALLGANGSGKSTLLKMLDGLAFPDAGSLTAFGESLTEQALSDPAANARFRSRVGLVFQNSETQLFSATVREDLAFGCRQLGLDAAHTEQRITQIAEMLQIEPLLERAPVHLSGGQQRRVALGSVLVMSPQVLLFDEPTAGLDPRTSGWLADLMAQLHATGRTMVVATHDLELTARLATRCLVLNEQHRVCAEGSPAEILADPALLAQANLIAAP